MDTLKHYLPLCWFKADPLKLTRSVSFFKQNLVFCFIVEFFMQANMTDDPFESFYEVGLETILTLLFIGVMLFFNKTLSAYVQIATAVLFCSNAVAIPIVPVLIWLTVSEDLLSYYVMGLILFWDYAMVAYIIRQVIGVNIAASMVLSLAYFIATYLGAFALGQLM